MLALLAALPVIVLAADVYVGAQAKSEGTSKDLTTTDILKPEASTDKPAPATVICGALENMSAHAINTMPMFTVTLI